MMKSRMLQSAMPEMSFEEEAGAQSLGIKPAFLCVPVSENKGTLCRDAPYLGTCGLLEVPFCAKTTVAPTSCTDSC